VRVLAVVVVAACAPLQPPRAVVRALAPADDAHHAVLVTPTTCVSTDPMLCDPQIYRGNQPSVGPLPAVDEVVDPILRLKLELAGYTLSDARTLRLTTVDRTDTTENSDARGQTTPIWQGTKLGEGPTVATLSPHDQASAARSLGLTGIMRSTLTVIHPSNFDNARFELVLEMFALPEGTPLWTVTCNEPFENWSETSRLLANCVGDGVLAWRAPDAVIARHL
jgi:hypothetical protein